MLKRYEGKKIRELQSYISSLDREIENHRKICRDPSEQAEFRAGKIHEIFLYQDEIELIKTEAMLRAANPYLIAIPNRGEQKYWSHSRNFGTNYFNSTGLEHMDKMIHEAKMRRVERFHSWFTPAIAILALIVSVFGLVFK